MTYTLLWVGWIVLFFVIEGAALLNERRGDTLSEHVWHWAGISGKGRFVKLRRLALLILLCWLTVHFLTGGSFL